MRERAKVGKKEKRKQHSALIESKLLLELEQTMRLTASLENDRGRKGKKKREKKREKREREKEKKEKREKERKERKKERKKEREREREREREIHNIHQLPNKQKSAEKERKKKTCTP